MAKRKPVRKALGGRAKQDPIDQMVDDAEPADIRDLNQPYTGAPRKRKPKQPTLPLKQHSDMLAHGGKAKPRLDKKARGGGIKHKGLRRMGHTHINIMPPMPFPQPQNSAPVDVQSGLPQGLPWGFRRSRTPVPI